MTNVNTSLQILPICGTSPTFSPIPALDASVCSTIYRKNCPTLCDSPSYTFQNLATPRFTNLSPIVNASSTPAPTQVKPAQTFSTTFSTALTPFQPVGQNVFPFPNLDIRTVNYLMKKPDLSALITNMQKSLNGSSSTSEAIATTTNTISHENALLAADLRELQSLNLQQEQLEKDLESWKSSPMGKRHAARALQSGSSDNSQGGQLTSKITIMKQQAATLEEKIAKRQEKLAEQKEILQNQQSELERQEATLFEQKQILNEYIETLESDEAELGDLEQEIKQLQKELKAEIERRETKKSENAAKLNENNEQLNSNDEQIRLKAEQAQKNAALKAARQEQIRKLRESIKA